MEMKNNTLKIFWLIHKVLLRSPPAMGKIIMQTGLSSLGGQLVKKKDNWIKNQKLVFLSWSYVVSSIIFVSPAMTLVPTLPFLWITSMASKRVAQSAGAVEYTDCTSAEG